MHLIKGINWEFVEHFSDYLDWKKIPNSYGPDEHYGLAQPLDDFLSDEELKKKKRIYTVPYNFRTSKTKLRIYDQKSSWQSNLAQWKEKSPYSI